MDINPEISLSECQKIYFFSLDAYNVLKSITSRELRWVFEGKTIIIFPDSYDLISYLFPKNMLLIDSHYDSVKALWNEVFEEQDSNDNIKFCVSPPSCLEIFHFLEKKASYFIKEIEPIEISDTKDLNSFFRKYKKVQYAYALTDRLIDQAKGQIKQFELLDKLHKEKKLILPMDIFDYKNVKWEEFNSIVSQKYDQKRSYDYLVKQRSKYHKEVKSKNKNLDLTKIGLDLFSVKIDVSNIAHTIYMDFKLEDFKSLLTSHGLYTLLCCSQDEGTWKGDPNLIPVKNSLAALYLIRAKRMFTDYDKSIEFYKGAQFAFRNYLKEIKKMPKVKEFITGNYNYRSNNKDQIIKKSDGFKIAEQYLYSYCDFTTRNVDNHYKIDEIKTTKINDAIEYSRDITFRKSQGEKFLQYSSEGINKIIYPEIMDVFFPADERTRELILKLKGYRLEDFE